MKKIYLLALLCPFFLGGLAGANETVRVVETPVEEKDFVVYEEKLSNDFKPVGTLRETVVVDQVTATSGTYVQYGKNTTSGNDILRFATAVKGNIDTLTYTLSYSGNNETYPVQYVYKGITVNGKTTYYNGSALSTTASDAGKYYWACITIEFKSEKQVNTSFTGSLKVVDKAAQTVNSTAYTTTLGNLKHKGYSAVNQTNNDTVIVPGSNNSVTITNSTDFCGFQCTHNMVLVNDKTYQGDYTISTSMVIPGVSFPVTKTYNQGLVVWYENEQNYLVAYTNYQTDKADLMREVQLTGMINGQVLPWQDFWTESWNGFTADKVNPGQSVELSVTKKGTQFSVKVNDIKVGTWVNGTYQYFVDLGAYSNFNGVSKVGYHVDTDTGTNTVQFSEIKLEKVLPNIYSSDNWSQVNGAESVWSVNENSETIVTTNSAWLGNFYISDVLTSSMTSNDDATITLNIKGTMGFPNSKDARVGFIPWFVDINNYVVIYLDWSATDRPSELRCIQMTGRVNGQFLPIWDNGWVNREWNDMWTNGTTISASDDITLSITKKITNGDSIRFSINVSNQNGVTRSVENGFGILNTGSLLPNGKMGLWAQNDTFTFSNISKTLLNA